MTLEEKIIKLLKKRGYTYSELCKELNISKEFLYSILKSLETNHTIFRTKNNSYVLTENSEYRFGTVEKRYDGTVFIKTDYGIVKVNSQFSKEVVNGDFVKVHLLDFTGENGLIEEIITKNDKLFTGTIIFKDGIKYVLPDDKKYRKLKIRLDDKDKIAEDFKVLFKLGKQYGNVSYDANIIKVIGHKNEPDIDMICKLEKEQIPYKFSDEVMNEVKQIPNKVQEQDLIGRSDFRNELIFTIDGDDSKDFDDAVSLKKLENGNYLLGVHIADVSHYIKEGSKLYDEALNRGTSIYLINRVIPMLPYEISNGICSLNEMEDRLTLSVIAEYSPDGDIIDSKIEKSVINSKKRMTYNNVNKVLNGEKVDGYDDFTETLMLMNELAKKFRVKRFKNGSINFEREEPKFILQNDKIIDICLRERKNAEKLIEEFMIEANKTVATYVYNMSIPFLYRGHRKPDVDNIVEIKKLLELLKIDVNFNLEEKYSNPLYVQKTLNLCKKTEYYDIICDRLLRAMRKAEYYPVPVDHYALAIGDYFNEFYTHFTSPIRRINDLLIHNIIKLFVIGDIYQDNVDYNSEFSKHEQLNSYYSIIASKTEKRAMELERYFDQQMICKYLQNFIGEKFKGKIIRIDEKGIVVECNNLFKFRIPAHTIPNFICDENKVYYYSNNEIHTLAETVDIALTSVSLEENVVYAKLELEKRLSKVYGNNK